MRDGNGVASNRSIVRTAERLAMTPPHSASAPLPIGVMAPIPVITTRRRGHRPPASASSRMRRSVRPAMASMNCGPMTCSRGEARR